MLLVQSFRLKDILKKKCHVAFNYFTIKFFVFFSSKQSVLVIMQKNWCLVTYNLVLWYRSTRTFDIPITNHVIVLHTVSLDRIRRCHIVRLIFLGDSLWELWQENSFLTCSRYVPCVAEWLIMALIWQPEGSSEEVNPGERGSWMSAEEWERWEGAL